MVSRYRGYHSLNVGPNALPHLCICAQMGDNFWASSHQPEGHKLCCFSSNGHSSVESPHHALRFAAEVNWSPWSPSTAGRCDYKANRKNSLCPTACVLMITLRLARKFHLRFQHPWPSVALISMLQGQCNHNHTSYPRSYIPFTQWSSLEKIQSILSSTHYRRPWCRVVTQLILSS